MPPFEHRHVVTFQETSLVGNVYFANYLLWQGHCRERFLHDHAPEVVDLLHRHELALFTARCSCEFRGDFGFRALDEVVIRMRLDKFRGGRMSLSFEYLDAARPDEPQALGSQDVHCKARTPHGWFPAPFPPPLVRALKPFAEGAELHAALDDALAFQLERERTNGA